MFHLFQATHIHQYNSGPIDLSIIVIDTMKHYRPTRWRTCASKSGIDSKNLVAPAIKASGGHA